jgi:hypothetical protein
MTDLRWTELKNNQFIIFHLPFTIPPWRARQNIEMGLMFCTRSERFRARPFSQIERVISSAAPWVCGAQSSSCFERVSDIP